MQMAVDFAAARSSKGQKGDGRSVEEGGDCPGLRPLLKGNPDGHR